MSEILKCECTPGSERYENDEGMQICLSCEGWIEEDWTSTMPYTSLEKIDKYTDCNQCHNPLPHCHCMCPYCGKRDECECVLFDTATGG